jgi:hypothetical protein
VAKDQLDKISSKRKALNLKKINCLSQSNEEIKEIKNNDFFLVFFNVNTINI